MLLSASKLFFFNSLVHDDAVGCKFVSIFNLVDIILITKIISYPILFNFFQNGWWSRLLSRYFIWNIMYPVSQIPNIGTWCGCDTKLDNQTRFHSTCLNLEYPCGKQLSFGFLWLAISSIPGPCWYDTVHVYAIRSWNNVIHCMSFYIHTWCFIYIACNHHILRSMGGSV